MQQPVQFRPVATLQQTAAAGRSGVSSFPYKQKPGTGVKPSIPGLEKLLFDPGPEARNRIIYSIEGHTKVRKSSFALWGPAPVVVFDIDHRLEHVIDRFQDGTYSDASPKQIVPHWINIPEIDPMSKKADESARTQAKAAWDQFLSLYEAAIKSSLLPGGVRTISIDDTTELYDLRLVAEFGRLQAIQQRDRGGANFDFVKLIDMGKEGGASVIWQSKVKEEWGTIEEIGPQGERRQKSMATGKFIPDGYKRLRQTVQVALRAQINPRWKPTDARYYEIEVIASGLNGETNGTVYTANDWDEYGPFAWISSEQLIETTPFDWQ
jgi:hypothetical protein